MNTFTFDPAKNIDDEGNPNNGQRAQWADKALETFKRAMGESGPVDADCWRDLISDLCHWADREGFEPQEQIESAMRRWEEER